MVVAIADPNDLQKIDEIKALFPGRQLKFCVGLQKDILDIIQLFTHDEKELAAIDDIIQQLQDEAAEVEDEERLVDEQDSAVVQLVNKIVLDAAARGASDIHIEPFPEAKIPRSRVDGNCTIYQTIPFSYKAVISRIKIMAGLDIAERRKPRTERSNSKSTEGRISSFVCTFPPRAA